MAGVDLSHVHHDAEEIIRAGPRQLNVLLRIVTSRTIRVREHVELQGEMHGSVNLGSSIAPSLLELEPLVDG